MRNSTAINARVPAPFTTLEPLRLYLDLLKEVVENPTPESVTAYVTHDHYIFTPVAHTSIDMCDRGDLRSCILYDGVRVHGLLAQIPDKYSQEFTRVYGENLLIPGKLTVSFDGTHSPTVDLRSKPAVPSDESREYYGSDAGLRNAARLVVNMLVKCVADSGAFPVEQVPAAFAMLDQMLLDLYEHDKETLKLARKRMSRELLNVWIWETQCRVSPHTGEHDEILRNVAAGWKTYGAPYRLAWFSKLVGHMNPGRYY